MTTPSHTELAARKLWETIKILGLQNEKLALQAIAAALESPERVQGERIAGLERCEFDDECEFCQSPQGGSFTRLVHNAEDCTESEFYICGDCAWKAVDAFRIAPTPPTAPAQYSLPDELYESKDWKAAGYAGRVEWLHAMYEAKKKELESFLSMATPPTAPAQDVHGQRNAQTLVDIGNAALRAGWNGVDMKAFVLARLAAPSPQAEKQPLGDADEALMRQALEALEWEISGYSKDGTPDNTSAAITALRARLETSK